MYEDRVSLSTTTLRVVVEENSTAIIREPEYTVTARRVYSGGWTISVGEQAAPIKTRMESSLAEAELYTGSYTVGVDEANIDAMVRAVEEASWIIYSNNCSPRVRGVYRVQTRSIAHGAGIASEKKGYSVLEVEAQCRNSRGYFKVVEAGLKAFTDRTLVRLAAAEALKTAKIVDQASRLNPLAAGRWTLILSRDASAALAEAIASMLRGDNPLILQGEAVGNTNVTLYDDPYTPVAPGARLFDDEAVKASRRTLVEEGEVVEYLETRETAVKHGGKPGNAHGLLEPPTPHYTVLVFKPGDWRLRELEEETRRGIIVDSVKTWWVDGRTVTIIPSRSWIVERGEARPVIVSRIRLRIPMETSTIDAVTRNYWISSKTFKTSIVSVIAPTIRLTGYVD